MSTIAVAFDGGRGSWAALRWGAWRASFDGSVLEVVCVLPNEPLPEFGPSGSFDDAANEVLRDASEWLAAEATGTRFRGSVRVGEPATTLAAVSAEADLMVVGSKRGDREVKARFEVVPRRVAVLSTGPTIVVPAVWEERPGPIIVGLDEGEADSSQLEFAAGLAALTGRGLEILHAWGVVPQPSRIPILVGSPELDAAHERYLATAAQHVREAHPGLEVTASSVGAIPLAAITAAAKRAALVVVGRRFGDRFGDWLFSHVTHDLLLSLPCPVAVVPPAARRTPATSSVASGQD